MSTNSKAVKISLWVVWAEQHAQYIQFLPRHARKELNVPKLKKLKAHCPNIYTVPEYKKFYGKLGLDIYWAARPRLALANQ